MSSPLDEGQQEFYRDRFGDRYVAVQEQPLQPSRRVRRALKHNRGITEQDAQLLDAQRTLRERITRGF